WKGAAFAWELWAICVAALQGSILGYTVMLVRVSTRYQILRVSSPIAQFGKMNWRMFIRIIEFWQLNLADNDVLITQVRRLREVAISAHDSCHTEQTAHDEIKPYSRDDDAGVLEGGTDELSWHILDGLGSRRPSVVNETPIAAAEEFGSGTAD